MNKEHKKEQQTREITPRSILLAIVWTVLSFFAYGWFWLYEINKETKALTFNEKGLANWLEVLLCITTLGIYTPIWTYKVAKKQDNFCGRVYQRKFYSAVIYLILLIMCVCTSATILFISIMGLIILNANFDSTMILALVIIFLFCQIMFLGTGLIISFSLLQNKNNDLIRLHQQTSGVVPKVTDNNLFNRPFWSTVILALIGLFAPQAIAGTLVGIIQSFNVTTSVNSIEDIENLTDQIIQQSANQVTMADDFVNIFTNISLIASAVLVLWWFKMRFKNIHYEGVLVRKNIGKAFLLISPAFIICLLNAAGFFLGEEINFKIGIIIFGFVPGFLEEIAVRGMLIPNLARIYSNDKGIWIALIVPAIIFGGMHAINIFAGADIGTTIFQVFYALALGFIFGAVLLRTGNLWASIICHGLIDTIALMSQDALEQGVVLTQTFEFSAGNIAIIVLSLFFVAYGIFLCRQKKRQEILDLWNDKWGRTKIEEERNTDGNKK